jgi:hypothetical protein
MVPPRAQHELFGRPQGTSQTSSEDRCPACEIPLPAPPTQAIVLEWTTQETLRLGDFTWPHFTYLPVVSEPLARELHDRFGGFELGPVEVRERRLRMSDFKPGARLPEAFLAANRRLVELRVTASCRLDPERSSIVRVRPPCAACGRDLLTWGRLPVPSLRDASYGVAVLESVEWWESGSWDPDTKDLARVRHPRIPGEGLFAHLDEPAGFCRLGNFVLCTDEVRDFVEARGCTNVGFLEAGEAL